MLNKLAWLIKLCTLAAFLSASADVVDSQASQPVAEAIAAVHLGEPVVKTSSTTLAEDSALVAAIQAYQSRTDPNDFSSFQTFVDAHPTSGWTAAIQTNLGISYLHNGFFSRAISMWQGAWANGKDATDPEAVALINIAIAQELRLLTALGKFDDLRKIISEIHDRAVTGAATEALQTAEETLTLAEKDPRHLLLCGPLALRELLIAEGMSREKANALLYYKASARGTSLTELAEVAGKMSFPLRAVFVTPSQDIPVPSVIHWKAGHFAAVISENNGRYRIRDTVAPDGELWATKAAVAEEASGYFLVPTSLRIAQAIREVVRPEGDKVWGTGPSSGTPPGGIGTDPSANHGPPHAPLPSIGANPGVPGKNPGNNPGDNPNGDPGDNPNCNHPGMCGYEIKESTVEVALTDTPVGYSPAIGPSVFATISYNQREDSQPGNFTFFNIGAKWTLNWLTYLIDDPTNQGASVSRYMSGGGAYYYSGYGAGKFDAQTNDSSVLSIVSWSPIQYQRRMSDGSLEIFAQSSGSTSYPRNVFLTKKVDAQGNATTYNYDSQNRLLSITDAVGRQTTLSYGLTNRPLLVTQITDPFGRSAKLTYDQIGRLKSITDVIGITSSVLYDGNSLVKNLTTPYGTTAFAFTAPGVTSPPRFVDVTDPMGFHEREEWIEPAPIPDSDPPATVPQGMPVAPTNQYLTYRDSFYWDKYAYVLAGCSVGGGCDYSKARDTHFLHEANVSGIKSTTIESIKYPLENRIWYNYPGQTDSIETGSSTQPVAIARVLDDGSTQLNSYSYDSYFNITQATDAVGRVTQYNYAANHTDLIGVAQKTDSTDFTTIQQYTYNGQHRPASVTDASGQTTVFRYDTVGLLKSVTNPLDEITRYHYDSSHNLTSITNANNQTAASLTYDAFARVHTYTDSEGWTVTYDYDALDRVTKKTYPDGTADIITYDKLDLVGYQDRQLRTWKFVVDANRRLTKVVLPNGSTISYGYNQSGLITSLTDAANVPTGWAYDVEGRLISKTFADNSSVSYTYETTTSRLHSVVDALNQTKQLSYTLDDLLSGITYLNAVNTTPNVAFAYDPFFPRQTSMTDGTGTTLYSYVPPYSLGALQLQQEVGPLPNSAISYAYDELQRLTSQTVAGQGSETFQFDAIGRLASHGSDLGQFSRNYLGQTGQMTQRQLTGSTLSTTWSYLPNIGDRRLAGIANVGLSAANMSTYQYTTSPDNLITSITETSDSATSYPSALSQIIGYNNLNQATNIAGHALSYDANGNLLSDGSRVYAWDAENRLVQITYPSVSGKKTSFAYDGLGRRTSIASTPAGGGSITPTSYIWCGTLICQARSAAGQLQREYFEEGEYLPGSSPQTLYYGVDQLGSVRRVFQSTSLAPAYSYDPYGASLNSTPKQADLNFAAMFYSADSGLYLTEYRIYDPIAGRWLSRDPAGERSDALANLYRYVQGNPINLVDELGLTAQAEPSSTPSSTPFSTPSSGCSNDNQPEQDALNWKQACFLIQCMLGTLDPSSGWKPKMPPDPPKIIIPVAPGPVKKPD